MTSYSDKLITYFNHKVITNNYFIVSEHENNKQYPATKLETFDTNKRKQLIKLYIPQSQSPKTGLAEG